MNVSILYLINSKKDIKPIPKVYLKLVKVCSYESFQEKTCQFNQIFKNNIKIRPIYSYFSYFFYYLNCQILFQDQTTNSCSTFIQAIFNFIKILSKFLTIF